MAIPADRSRPGRPQRPRYDSFAGLVSKGAGGGDAVFNPLSLFSGGETGGWYDPSDFSSMFQDTGGSTPVTATGQSVARINDKSGRGNTLTQATAGFRPTLQQDASGHYYLSFDGVDDTLVSAASLAMAITGALTMMSGVYKNVGSTYGHIACSETDSSLNIPFQYRLDNNATNPIQQFFQADGAGQTAAVGTAASAIALTTPTVLLTTRSGGFSTFQRNLAAAESISLGGTATATAANTFRLAARFDGFAYLAGRIYGLLLISRLLTPAETTGLQAFMNTKTGAY